MPGTREDVLRAFEKGTAKLTQFTARARIHRDGLLDDKEVAYAFALFDKK